MYLMLYTVLEPLKSARWTALAFAEGFVIVGNIMLSS
jgi:hypothetical protein